MNRTVRKCDGAIWLPIVDVDFVLLGLKNNPRTTEILIGARRQAVVKVVQMLEAAKRDQIDGQVRLDVKDIGLLLQTMALAMEFMADVIYVQGLDDDEQI